MKFIKDASMYRRLNILVSLFIVLSIVTQFILVIGTIGAVWLIDGLLPITIVLLVGNFGYGVVLLFLIIVKRKKELVASLAWMMLNQFILLISLFILFATGMTIANF